MEIRVVYRPVSELNWFDGNPKDHDIPALIDSLQKFGYTAPVIIDERDDTVVAGHGRLEALETMRADGRKPPRRIRVAPDGEWMVPTLAGVEFDDLEQAKLYILTDNRTTELGGWDLSELQAFTSDMAPDVLAPLAIPDLLAELEPIEVSGHERTRTSAPPEHEPLPRRVESGDLWHLGRHRLLCADSLGEDTRALLPDKVDAVVTDPPYAVYGSSTGVSSEVSDDAMVVPFFHQIASLAKSLIEIGGHVYVFCDWRSWGALWEGARRAKLEPKNMLIWDKGNGLGTNYMNYHELVMFLARIPDNRTLKQSSILQTRPINEPNVFRFPRVPTSERWHTAAKPVALLEQLIANSTDRGGVILDPFAGGGSTLIAADNIDRTCWLVEKEPAVADTILARWEQATGSVAVRADQ